jgi:hypothetical protein
MYLQSLSQIMNASMEELARCPGIGERKVLQRAHIGYPQKLQTPYFDFFAAEPCFPGLICVYIICSTVVGKTTLW